MILESTIELANAIRKFNEDAHNATESQILEAEKLLQTQGLSKDVEILFMRIKIEILLEKCKKYESENT